MTFCVHLPIFLEEANYQRFLSSCFNYLNNYEKTCVCVYPVQQNNAMVAGSSSFLFLFFFCVD